jgi:hypothetical protein
MKKETCLCDVAFRVNEICLVSVSDAGLVMQAKKKEKKASS